MQIRYLHNQNELRIVKQSDKDLIDDVQNLLSNNTLSCINIKFDTIIGDDAINVNPSQNELKNIGEHERLSYIASLDSHVFNAISMNFIDNRIQVNIKRDYKDSVSDVLEIKFDNSEVKSYDMVLKFVADVKLSFRHINIDNERLKISDDYMSKIHQMREADISVLRSTLKDMLKQLQVESRNIRRENDEELRGKKDEFENKYNILEEKLMSDIEKKKETLDAREAELEARIKDVNDKESKFERRAIHEEMKKTIRDRMAKLKITIGTKLLRLPIHGIFVTLIITFSVLLYRYSITTLTGQQNTGQQILNTLMVVTLTKSFIFGILLGTTALFYIKWQMAWFKQHADEEFRMKKFNLDIDRANWIVEMLIEWEKENKMPIPDGLITHFTKGMFSDGASTDAIQHPLEEVITSITKSAIRAKVSTPNGLNCEVEKK